MHVSASICIYICIFKFTYLYVYACIVCITVIAKQYLPVLYVLGQISTQAISVSSNDPPLGRQPAGLTQSSCPTTLRCHRGPTPGLGPVLAFSSYRGVGQNEPLVPRIGLQCHVCVRRSRDSRLKQHPSRSGGMPPGLKRTLHRWKNLVPHCFKRVHMFMYLYLCVCFVCIIAILFI
jgi:hypothetical protein